MHNLTLGYNPNPQLEYYRDRFLLKLQYLWKRHIQNDLPSDDFLLFPDIHALLLYFTKPDTHDSFNYKNILLQELSLYGTTESILFPESGNIIPGTHIEITNRFYNPDIDTGSHPDHKKNNVGVTFGSKGPQEWCNLFSQAFDIVHRVSPEFMCEIDMIIKKIIPFDVSSRVHNSGSYSNSIGHLLMSYPVDMDYPEISLLEAILHEYNHNKLNIILQIEQLVLNDRREIYYSPYRPDARHIHGIYLGLHAIAGAYWIIWNAHLQGTLTLNKNWQEKAVIYVLKNGLSIQILNKYAILSPLGKKLLDEMISVHKECLTFIQKSSISQDIIRSAQQALIDHHRTVQMGHPGILS